MRYKVAVVAAVVGVLIAVSSVFAQTGILEALGGILSMNGLAASLGVGVLGMFGVLTLMRRALVETVDFFVKLRAFVHDFAQEFKEGPWADRAQELAKEANEAAESIAAVLARLGMRGVAGRLRELV